MFCNFIIDGQVIKVRDIVIDSWSDLTAHEDIEIVVIEKDLMIQYQKEFANKMNIIQYPNIMNDSYLKQLSHDMTSGRSAFVLAKQVLTFILLRMAGLVRQSEPAFLDNIHVSKRGGMVSPYFITSMLDNEHPYLTSINNL